MRLKRVLPILSIALIISLSLISFAQNDQNDDDEANSRGSFIGSRPVKSDSSEAKPTNVPKSTTRPTNRPKPDGSKVKRQPGNTETSGNGKEKQRHIPINSDQESVKALGLGYTIYKRNENGQPISVSPNEKFYTGDAIRITMEPNTDGYLYIFHTENNGKPIMLFPDARLQRGNNAVRGHVPYEVPSSQDPEASLRWFVFAGDAATEHLFLVVTREPLAEVPTNEALVNYCVTNRNTCPWQPAERIWSNLTSNLNKGLVVSKSKTHGQLQSETESRALTRIIQLPKDAPEPSVVLMSASINNDILVTAVDLTHIALTPNN